MKRLSMCAESIRAIQAGAKDLTTRAVVPQPHYDGEWYGFDDRMWANKQEPFAEELARYAPYHVGERVALSETWGLSLDPHGPHGFRRLIEYAADGAVTPCPEHLWPLWDRYEKSTRGYLSRSSRFMPAEFSRQVVVITSITTGRLHDMTNDDYRREGVETLSWYTGDLRAAYMEWWERLNGKRYPWGTNPWVWRFGFEREVQ